MALLLPPFWALAGLLISVSGPGSVLTTSPAELRANPIEFFVAPSGSDASPGTVDRPFATLERAQQAVRVAILASADGDPTAPRATVWVEAGTYQLDESLTFGPSDSGLPGRPVVWRARGEGEVRLIGGEILPAERAVPVTDRGILARLPTDAAREHVRQYDVSSLRERADASLFGDLVRSGHGHPVLPAGLELFADHEPMTLARYPNAGSMKIGRVLDSGSVPRTGDRTNRGAVFEYTDDRHARWAGVDDVWLQGTFMWGYADDRILVDHINPETRQVKLAAPHLYGVGTGQDYRQYYALNLLEELDAPGEWYFDRSNAVVYFWPRTPLVDTEVAVSTLRDPLIKLVDASHVVIRDITIEYGRGMGAYIEGGESNTLAGLTIRNVGTIGILMGQGAMPASDAVGIEANGGPQSGVVGSLLVYLYNNTAWNRNAGKRHVVRSCDVYNTGAGGIFLSGGDRHTLEPGESVAENNKTWNNQRRAKFGWAGIIVDGVGNRVAHNDISQSDFQGIVGHGNEHVFEYNHVYDIGMDSDDTSPWYMGRDPSGRGHIVRYNYFHDIGRKDRMGMGVYLDDGTSGAVVHGNVFDRVASYGTVYSNAGSDISITNNIFLNGFGPALHIKSMWYTWARGHIPTYWDEGGIYRQRMQQAVDIASPPYSDRYPELTDWFDVLPVSTDVGKTYAGMIPRRNVFAQNLIVNTEEAVRLDHANIQIEIRDNWQIGHDPGFRDWHARDYTLVDTAAVFTEIPGFEAIPFEKIGLYRDEYRTRGTH